MSEQLPGAEEQLQELLAEAASSKPYADALAAYQSVSAYVISWTAPPQPPVAFAAGGNKVILPDPTAE